MWYVKNETPLQQPSTNNVACLMWLFFCTFIYFLGYHLNIIYGEVSQPVVLYWETALVLSSFWCPFPTFLLFPHFKWKKCHYIVNTSGFFFFWEKLRTFKNLKQIKYKKSVCVVYFYVLQSDPTGFSATMGNTWLLKFPNILLIKIGCQVFFLRYSMRNACCFSTDAGLFHSQYINRNYIKYCIIFLYGPGNVRME